MMFWTFKAMLKNPFLLQKMVVNRTCPGRSSLSEKNIVFLSGVQRSGTNMMMDCLEKSMDTDVFHETDPNAFDSYMMRSPETLRSLFERSGYSCIVFKALMEADLLGSLATRYRSANIIWAFRNLEDTVNSIVKTWPRSRNLIDGIVSDAGLEDWRNRGMTTATREVVKRHYRPDLSTESAQALFWYHRNQLFFDQGFDDSPAAFVLHYDDLVRHPDVLMPPLCTALGIRYHPRMIADVRPTSIGRHATPEIDPAIRGLCETMYGQLHEVWRKQLYDWNVQITT